MTRLPASAAAKMTDTELKKELDWYGKIYVSSDINKANLANWYMTIITNEIMKRNKSNEKH